MSAVVLRCTNCGTTQATPGECDACHEAIVRPYCPNHEPGRWLTGMSCPDCGARLGVDPSGAPVPPAPPADEPGGRVERAARPIPPAPPAHPPGHPPAYPAGHPPRPRPRPPERPAMRPPARPPERAPERDASWPRASEPPRHPTRPSWEEPPEPEIVVRRWPTGGEVGGGLPRGWPGRPPTEVDVPAVVRGGASAIVGCLTRLVVLAAILVALVLAFFSGLFGAEPRPAAGAGGGAPAPPGVAAPAAVGAPEAGAFGPGWGINPLARPWHTGRAAAGGPPVGVCTVQGAAPRSETSGRALASSRRTSRDSLLPFSDSFNQFPAA